MKILCRGLFIATFKRTYIQDQAWPIIVTSLLSYETSPYFSWREKSLLPKFLSQLEPCFVEVATCNGSTKCKYLSQTDMKLSENLERYSDYFGVKRCLQNCEKNILYSNVISFRDFGSC